MIFVIIDGKIVALDIIADPQRLDRLAIASPNGAPLESSRERHEV
jgi:hypothetical protein